MTASDRPRRNPSGLSEVMHRRLDDARLGLLGVHKALLDHERVRYERANGPVASSSELLQLVIHDPWFNWLHPISELTVQIDELQGSKERVDPDDAEALLATARELLRPDENGPNDLRRNYFRAMQESPKVVMAHAEWKRLGGGGTGGPAHA